MKSNSINKVKGFTLLELMVVIVILGILGSLVIPSVMGNQEKAMMQKNNDEVETMFKDLTLPVK